MEKPGLKIAVMTFWWSEDNYGQLLQAWALQEYLKSLGHRPFFVRYKSILDIHAPHLLSRLRALLDVGKTASYLLGRLKVCLTSLDKKIHPRGFNEFRKNWLVFSDTEYKIFQQLALKPPLADAYICGSDQIWNFPDDISNCSDAVRAYFLDFVPEGKGRFACSASFGRDIVSKDFVEFIRPLLAKFKFVSVREPIGTEICKNAGYKGAEWSLDPTLLLDPNRYESLLANVDNSSGKYGLLYLVGNECKVDMREIRKLAKDSGCELKYVASQMKVDVYKKIHPTIESWLSLIRSAEWIVTNSYHGMIFSIIFRKRFVVVPLRGSAVYERMNGRVYSLLERLGLDDKHGLNGFAQILEQSYDWEKIHMRLKEIKDTSRIQEILCEYSRRETL